ncbi:universal stress protein [Streptomyces fragilis]|uniref:Universal stress protein n=1 Tax=Streptomyces fragilis TaxID=67301 RepID=A0ABV2YPT1_9ACTN|nr:universal stress protein [Streptomyces fragilis]
MTRTIVAAIDGSPASRSAAGWAAREAELRGLPLTLVKAWEPLPDRLAAATGSDPATLEHWSGRVLRAVAEEITGRRPGLEVTERLIAGRPAEVLPEAAAEAELLVLGSRGLGRIGGFLVGSVGQSVVASSRTPVVLVRAGETGADEFLPAAPAGGRPAFRPVVLGIDTDRPGEAVTAFAFEEAARRGAPLHVVQSWALPPYTVHAVAAAVDLYEQYTREMAALLTETLAPWREKFPAVEVVEVSRTGGAADHLLDASAEASLVVVGRRIRRGALGVHIGPVAHAVLHHAIAPVAVVAHE